jgi:hypothetical protein
MAESKRGGLLTFSAIAFVLLGISNISKPLSGGRAGLVFFGTKLAGTPNAILGPLFGIILIVYGVGIWRMRRYALYLAYTYAIYVAINMFMFGAKNPPPATQREMIFIIVYMIVALTVTWGTAILLTQRRAELT